MTDRATQIQSGTTHVDIDRLLAGRSRPLDVCQRIRSNVPRGTPARGIMPEDRSTSYIPPASRALYCVHADMLTCSGVYCAAV